MSLLSSFLQAAQTGMADCLASVFRPGAAQNGMLYDLPLKETGIVLGIALIIAHLAALFWSSQIKTGLKKLPRSEVAGSILLTLAAVWAFFLVWRMDLGEFQPQRRLLMIIVPILYFGALFFMTEFLAVRALGMLALLAADLLLDAAFLRDPITRLLLPVLAYAWIFFGMFWVGMPYLLRDQINWLTATPLRFRSACVAGLIYGAAVLLCAVFFW